MNAKIDCGISFIQVSVDALSQNTDSLKCWCIDDRLNWSDFRGKKLENEAGFLKAATAIGIIPTSFRKDDVLGYQVKVVVRRYESWKTDTSKHLLTHEQLHFDIAELTARKLRKAIHGIMVRILKPTSQDFLAVFQKFYLESGSMQTEYDDDTVHGVIAESQIAWEKKVSLQLRELEDYASTSKDCQGP